MNEETNTVTFKNNSGVKTIPVKLIKKVKLVRDEKHSSGTLDFRTIFKLKFSDDKSLNKRFYMKIPEESDSSKYHELDSGEQKIYKNTLKSTLKILSELHSSNFFEENEYNLYLNSIESCVVEYSRWKTEDMNLSLDEEIQNRKR